MSSVEILDVFNFNDVDPSVIIPFTVFTGNMKASSDDGRGTSSISPGGYPWEEGLRKEPAILRQFDDLLRRSNCPKSARRHTEDVAVRSSSRSDRKKCVKTVRAFQADTYASIARRMSSGKAVATSPQHITSNSSGEGFSEVDDDFRDERYMACDNLEESKNEPPEPHHSPPEPTNTDAFSSVSRERQPSAEPVKENRLDDLWKETIPSLRDCRESAKKELPTAVWDGIVGLYESHIEALFECFRVIHDDDQRLISVLTQGKKPSAPPPVNKQEDPLSVKERRIRYLESKLVASNKRFHGVSDTLQGYQQRARFSSLNEKRATETHSALESAMTQIRTLEEDRSDLHKIIKISEARIASLEGARPIKNHNEPYKRTASVGFKGNKQTNTTNQYAKNTPRSSQPHQPKDVQRDRKSKNHSSSPPIPQSDMVAALMNTMKEYVNYFIILFFFFFFFFFCI